MVRAAVFTLVLTLQPGRSTTPFDASTPFAAAPMPLGEPGQGCPLGHCQAGEPGPAQRSLAVRAADTVNVRDWLARGDGKRATPHDEGVDISTASWNDWKKYPFFTDKAWSPYWVTGAFKPPRPTPFVSTDTWDSIGINLAVWNAAGQAEVFLPAGGYSVTVECPILMMKGMSSSIRGAGMYHTTIGTHENASFFAKSAGQEAKYGLFYAYHVGGPPTYIENLCISGPAGYQSDLHNLVGIRMENTNGFYFQSCWFTSFEAGLWLASHSGDCFVDECVAEFNHGGMLHMADATCNCFVRNSNLWNSGGDQYGVYSNGSPVMVSGSKLVGYTGAGVFAGGGTVDVQNNQFDSCAIGVQGAGGSSIISNNKFNGRGSKVPNGTALISTAQQPAPGVGGFVGSYVINGNMVEDDSAPQNPTVLLAHAVTGVLSGNSFHKHNVTNASGGGVYIIDVQEGDGEAAVGALVTGNSFRAAGKLAGQQAISPRFKGEAVNNLGVLKSDDCGLSTTLLSAPPTPPKPIPDHGW